MIKLRRHAPQHVAVYDNHSDYVGSVNFEEFCDIAIQIAQQNVRGWYIQHESKRYVISPNGGFENPIPLSIFGTSIKTGRTIAKIVKARQEEERREAEEENHPVADLEAEMEMLTESSEEVKSVAQKALDELDKLLETYANAT